MKKIAAIVLVFLALSALPAAAQGWRGPYGFPHQTDQVNGLLAGVQQMTERWQIQSVPMGPNCCYVYAGRYFDWYWRAVQIPVPVQFPVPPTQVVIQQVSPAQQVPPQINVHANVYVPPPAPPVVQIVQPVPAPAPMPYQPPTLTEQPQEAQGIGGCEFGSWRLTNGTRDYGDLTNAPEPKKGQNYGFTSADHKTIRIAPNGWVCEPLPGPSTHYEFVGRYLATDPVNGSVWTVEVVMKGDHAKRVSSGILYAF